MIGLSQIPRFAEFAYGGLLALAIVTLECARQGIGKHRHGRDWEPGAGIGGPEDYISSYDGSPKDVPTSPGAALAKSNGVESSYGVKKCREALTQGTQTTAGGKLPLTARVH